MQWLYRLPIALLLMCVVLAGSVVGPPVVAEERKGRDRVLVDEFLFPLPGALEGNLALLGEQVRDGAGARVQAMFGIQLLAKGDHVEAKSHCFEALARGTLFEPVYCMSMITFKEGMMKEAALYATQAIELRPSSVAAYIVLANVRMALKDKGGMARAVEMGIASLPERIDFWEWELAKMFEQLGDLDSALQCIGVLSRVTAQDPRVFTQAGDWLREKGRLLEASQMYVFALSKASWYQPAALSLVETYREAKEWSEIHRVVPDLLANAQLLPIHPTLAHHLGEANELLLDQELAAIEGRTGTSLEDLNSFEAVEPGRSAEILFEAAAACRRFQAVPRAVPLLRKANVRSPGNADVLLMLGEVYLELGQVELASSFLADAVDVEPGPEVYLALARAKELQGEAKECLAGLDKALEFRPDYTEAMLQRSLCHRKLRQSGQELAALERAFTVSPEDPRVLEQLTRYYLHMRHGEEKAASYLEKLYNLVPNDFRLCDKLARLRGKLGERGEELNVLAKCMGSVPPYREDLRRETYARMSSVIEKVRSVDAVVSALRRTCSTDWEQACDDLVAYTAKKKRKASLRRQTYRPSRRGRKMTGELERLGHGGGDFLVLGLDAPGFDKLARGEKIFLYYMSRAAIAGNDLLYFQNHRHAFVIKQLMERLFGYRRYLSKEQTDAIHDYLKYVWVNHGNYDHRSGVKFVPRLLTPGELLGAMKAVFERGEGFDFIPGSGIEEKFAYIEKAIFDMATEPSLLVTEKGRDIVLDSAVNHFAPGVTESMLEELDERVRNALNVRFDLVGGKVVPRYYKIGGLGSKYLENVVYFLEKAVPYAQGDKQLRSVEKLVEFYRIGDEALFRDHSVEWLKTRGRTDFINGFVEQLKDPRGIIGNFEGMSAFVSDAALVDKLAGEAEYFEKAMPWPEQFKRDKVVRPVSNVATVLMGTGDMGPVPWAGYNLPNYADIRSNVGSKNVIFLNIMTSGSQRDRSAVLEEFYLPEYRPLVKEYGELVTNWNVYMHEIIGHGSGKPDPGLKGDPRNLIGRSFSALEEARADLVALYFMGDRKLVEIGALPDQTEAILKAAYARYFQGFLNLYPRFHGEVIKEAHWKGRQLILKYLLEGGIDGKGDFGLKVVEDGGNFFVKLEDVWKMRTGIGELLGKIQVMKSMGNKEGAEALLDRFGTTYDRKWQENLAARASRIGIARQSAFVFPRLQPVVDRQGNVVDVRIYHDEDLTSQQFRFSRLQAGQELE